jgi:HAE1 family hydrophobic/amphiphilic exporter-1
MTTIAMAAGVFPSALGLGDGGGFRSPMAIAVTVTGVLIASTLLSLVFAPAAFTLADDAGRLAQRLLGRIVGATDEPAPAIETRPGREAEPGGFPAPAE